MKLSHFSVSVVAHGKLKIHHWEFRNTSQIYLRTSGRSGNLERTGGQVSKVNIFERRDLSSCVKEKSYFNFGHNYLTNREWLNFSFCRKWKLHLLTRVLVCLYSFITPHKSISPTWSSSCSTLHRSVIWRWEACACRHIYLTYVFQG
jgi:hypothetical protein